MKNIRMIVAVLVSALIIAGLSSCDSQKSDNQLKSIEKPKTSATADEAENLTVATNSVEKCSNVNGMRFNMTLREFTVKYNNELKNQGEKTQIALNKWQKSGDVEKDNNGVEVQYCYYDDEKFNLTASVEAKSEKLLNIGLGTTLTQFMGTTDNQNNSDIILSKAALMAQAVCGFPEGSSAVLQDIFYRTTTGSNDTLWYKGYVFHLSTKEDKSDSKNNIMLFRVFPVTDELKEEWKLVEYK